MTQKYLLGLDLGGGGARALLVGCETGECFAGTRSWSFQVADETFGLGFDLDLDSMWGLIGEACGEALMRAGVQGDAVAAIAVSALRFGNVILDRTGAALFAVPNRDARGAAEGFQLSASVGDELLRETGLWPMPIHSSARLLWLAKHEPEILERGDCLLALSDWVNFRLCGVRVSDHSQAGCTGLYDLAKREWSWDRIDSLGFPRALFPEVKSAGSPLGSLGASAASDLGLVEGTPIGLGGGDTQCGLLGAGAIAPGEVASIAGTTAPVQAVCDRAQIDPEGRLWSGHHVIPGLWVLESNGGPMGETLTWISRLLFPDAAEPVAAFLEEAARSEIGSAGMLSTLGAEVMNARAPGMPVGQITLSHMTCSDDPQPRRHLARSVVEGHACAVRANLEQLRQATSCEFPALRLSGGLSRSDFFAQMLSDVTGVVVHTGAIPEATALGAALCAGVSAGIDTDFSAAVSARVKDRKVCEPDAAAADASRELYESWCRLRDAGAETSAPAAAAHVTPWVLKAGL